MPIKGGEMTSRERVFAEAYAATGDRKEAQRRAGYKGHTGVVMAMQRPEVQAEIRAHQLKRLNNELLPLALDVVQAVLSDVNESARNRLTAAKIVIDRTTGPENASEAKEPHEMTAEEIQARLDALRREASNRAVKVIDASSPPADEDPGAFG